MDLDVIIEAGRLAKELQLLSKRLNILENSKNTKEQRVDDKIVYTRNRVDVISKELQSKLDIIKRMVWYE